MSFVPASSIIGRMHFPTAVDERNDYYWRSLYLREFATCTYPPPMPHDSASPLGTALFENTIANNGEGVAAIVSRPQTYVSSDAGEGSRRQSVLLLYTPSPPFHDNNNQNTKNNTTTTSEAFASFRGNSFALGGGDGGDFSNESFGLSRRGSLRKMAMAEEASVMVTRRRSMQAMGFAESSAGVVNAGVGGISSPYLGRRGGGLPPHLSMAWWVVSVAALRSAGWPLLMDSTMLSERRDPMLRIGPSTSGDIQGSDTATVRRAREDDEGNSFVKALMQLLDERNAAIAEAHADAFDEAFVVKRNAEALNDENIRRIRWGKPPLKRLPRSMLFTRDHLAMARDAARRLQILKPPTVFASNTSHFSGSSEASPLRIFERSAQQSNHTSLSNGGKSTAPFFMPLPPQPLATNALKDSTTPIDPLRPRPPPSTARGQPNPFAHTVQAPVLKSNIAVDAMELYRKKMRGRRVHAIEPEPSQAHASLLPSPPPAVNPDGTLSLGGTVASIAGSAFSPLLTPRAHSPAQQVGATNACVSGVASAASPPPLRFIYDEDGYEGSPIATSSLRHRGTALSDSANTISLPNLSPTGASSPRRILSGQISSSAMGGRGGNFKDASMEKTRAEKISANQLLSRADALRQESNRVHRHNVNASAPSSSVAAAESMVSEHQHMLPFMLSICDPNDLAPYRSGGGGGLEGDFCSAPPIFSAAATWKEAVLRRRQWPLSSFLFFLTRDSSFNDAHFIAMLSLVEDRVRHHHVHHMLSRMTAERIVVVGGGDGTSHNKRKSRTARHEQQQDGEERKGDADTDAVGSSIGPQSDDDDEGHGDDGHNPFTDPVGQSCDPRPLCVSITASRTGAGLHNLSPVEENGSDSPSHRASQPISSQKQESILMTPSNNLRFSPECPLLLMEKTIYDIVTVLEGSSPPSPSPTSSFRCDLIVTPLNASRCVTVLMRLLRYFTDEAIQPSPLNTRSDADSSASSHYPPRPRVVSEVEYSDTFLLVDMLSVRSNFQRNRDASYPFEDSMTNAIAFAQTVESRLWGLKIKQQAHQEGRRGGPALSEKENAPTAPTITIPIIHTSLFMTPLMILTAYAKPYVAMWIRPLVGALADLFNHVHQGSAWSVAEQKKLERNIAEATAEVEEAAAYKNPYLSANASNKTKRRDRADGASLSWLERWRIGCLLSAPPSTPSAVSQQQELVVKLRQRYARANGALMSREEADKALADITAKLRQGTHAATRCTLFYTDAQLQADNSTLVSLIDAQNTATRQSLERAKLRREKELEAFKRRQRSGVARGESFSFGPRSSSASQASFGRTGGGVGSFSIPLDEAATVDEDDDGTNEDPPQREWISIRDVISEREDHILDCIDRSFEIFADAIGSPDDLLDGSPSSSSSSLMRSFPAPLRAMLSSFGASVYSHLLSSLVPHTTLQECRDSCADAIQKEKENAAGGGVSDAAGFESELLVDALVASIEGFTAPKATGEKSSKGGANGGGGGGGVRESPSSPPITRDSLSSVASQSPLLGDIKGARIARLVLMEALVIPMLRDPIAAGLAMHSDDPYRLMEEAGGGSSRGGGGGRRGPQKPSAPKRSVSNSRLKRSDSPRKGVARRHDQGRPASLASVSNEEICIDSHSRKNFFAFSRYLQTLVNAPFVGRKSTAIAEALKEATKAEEGVAKSRRRKAEEREEAGKSAVISPPDSVPAVTAVANGITGKDIAACFMGLPLPSFVPPFITGIINISSGLYVHRTRFNPNLMLKHNQSIFREGLLKARADAGLDSRGAPRPSPYANDFTARNSSRRPQASVVASTASTSPQFTFVPSRTGAQERGREAGGESAMAEGSQLCRSGRVVSSVVGVVGDAVSTPLNTQVAPFQGNMKGQHQPFNTAVPMPLSSAHQPQQQQRNKRLHVVGWSRGDEEGNYARYTRAFNAEFGGDVEGDSLISSPHLTFPNSPLPEDDEVDDILDADLDADEEDVMRLTRAMLFMDKGRRGAGARNSHSTQGAMCSSSVLSSSSFSSLSNQLPAIPMTPTDELHKLMMEGALTIGAVLHGSFFQHHHDSSTPTPFEVTKALRRLNVKLGLLAPWQVDSPDGGWEGTHWSHIHQRTQSNVSFASSNATAPTVAPLPPAGGDGARRGKNAPQTPSISVSALGEAYLRAVMSHAYSKIVSTASFVGDDGRGSHAAEELLRTPFAKLTQLMLFSSRQCDIAAMKEVRQPYGGNTLPAGDILSSSSSSVAANDHHRMACSPTVAKSLYTEQSRWEAYRNAPSSGLSDAQKIAVRVEMASSRWRRAQPPHLQARAALVNITGASAVDYQQHGAETNLVSRVALQRLLSSVDAIRIRDWSSLPTASDLVKNSTASLLSVVVSHHCCLRDDDTNHLEEEGGGERNNGNSSANFIASSSPFMHRLKFVLVNPRVVAAMKQNIMINNPILYDMLFPTPRGDSSSMATAFRDAVVSALPPLPDLQDLLTALATRLGDAQGIVGPAVDAIGGFVLKASSCPLPSVIDVRASLFGIRHQTNTVGACSPKGPTATLALTGGGGISSGGGREGVSSDIVFSRWYAHMVNALQGRVYLLIVESAPICCQRWRRAVDQYMSMHHSVNQRERIVAIHDRPGMLPRVGQGRRKGNHEGGEVITTVSPPASPSLDRGRGLSSPRQGHHRSPIPLARPSSSGSREGVENGSLERDASMLSAVVDSVMIHPSVHEAAKKVLRYGGGGLPKTVIALRGLEALCDQPQDGTLRSEE